MSDLTDAEVERRFAQELRQLPSYHPHWLWQAAKALPGWLWSAARSWSPAKWAMFMTGASWVFLVVLVLRGEWKAAFILTVIYIPLMAILITFAILESERPNGRAAQIRWTNERVEWPRQK